MRQLAHEHGIELFCLPPHTTHRTQPLDVGVFGPLQRRWMERCDDVLEETGEEIRKVDFVKEYMVARNLAFVPDTITKAWKKAGDLSLEPRYLYACRFCTQYHLFDTWPCPSSYPCQPSESDDDSTSDEGPDTDGDGTCSGESDSEHEQDDSGSQVTHVDPITTSAVAVTPTPHPRLRLPPAKLKRRRADLVTVGSNHTENKCKENVKFSV